MFAKIQGVSKSRSFENMNSSDSNKNRFTTGNEAGVPHRETQIVQKSTNLMQNTKLTSIAEEED